MARKLTDRVQISGYLLLMNRIRQAFVSGDVQGLASPIAAHNRWMLAGVTGALLICVAGLLAGLISPSSKPGNARIVTTKAGARFVVVDGVVHPVTNLASARLLAGSPDKPKTVGDKELEKYPRGQLMGIASAPDDLRMSADTVSRWVVCSQYDRASQLALTRATSARTAVFAGSVIEAGTRRVGNDDAVLVRQAASTADETDTTSLEDVWLLFRGQRIDVAQASPALRTTLGINDEKVRKAIPVTKEFLDAVPARQPFDKPFIVNEGHESKAVAGATVGSVVRTAGAAGDQFWLVESGGVQKIGPFAAALLVNSGSAIDKGGSAKMAGAPQSSTTRFDGYPQSAPRIITGADTVCLDWSREGKGAAKSVILAGDGVPLSADDRSAVVTLLPPRDSTPQADFFYTPPGRGWLVAATGSAPNSAGDGQLWWVADNGMRYAVGSDKDGPGAVLSALGWGIPSAESGPLRVPWAVLRLLPAGNTLEPDAARVVHANIPPDMGQGVAPDVKGLN